MAGIGKRFQDAGYSEIKPLTKVDGKHYIEHVVKMFDNENKNEYIFICTNNQLANTNLRQVLLETCENCNIIEIDAHKRGPAFSLLHATAAIKDQSEVIVSYCDYSVYWNFNDFLKHTRDRDADGAIPAYKGFHPHMLGTDNYAFIKESKQWLIEIKEKEPFTNNRLHEYASCGAYYFKHGRIIKKYLPQVLSSPATSNGEHYISQLYNFLTKGGHKTSIYEIQHMLQWGTPNDLEEYNYWSSYFEARIHRRRNDTLREPLSFIMPAAGVGNRFKALYPHTPKQLLPVSGNSMLSQAQASLFEAFNLDNNQITIVCENQLVSKLASSERQIIALDSATDGQASSAMIAVDELPNDRAFVVTTCDSAFFLDIDKFQVLTAESVDVIVFSFKNYKGAQRSPQEYGWASHNDGTVIETFIKDRDISDTENLVGLTGTFYFKNKSIFLQCYEQLVLQKQIINDEYYIDSMIAVALQLKLAVKTIVVDHFLCWGTPDEYQTFNYWQSFFHKCHWHPYSIEKDPTIPAHSIKDLRYSFTTFQQENI